MRYEATLTGPGGYGEAIVGHPSWESPEDVCKAFGIEGLGILMAVVPGCRGYRPLTGPYAGLIIRVMPRYEFGETEGPRARPPIYRLDAPSLPAYTNSELGLEELAEMRRGR